MLRYEEFVAVCDAFHNDLTPDQLALKKWDTESPYSVFYKGAKEEQKRTRHNQLLKELTARKEQTLQKLDNIRNQQLCIIILEEAASIE
jgi:hypothetical protein